MRERWGDKGMSCRLTLANSILKKKNSDSL